MLQLEQRLGVQLIDRSTRPLQLTPLGQAYYEGCKRPGRAVPASWRRRSASARPRSPRPCRWPPSTPSAWATWASTSSASRPAPRRQGPHRLPAPRPGLREGARRHRRLRPGVVPAQVARADRRCPGARRRWCWPARPAHPLAGQQTVRPAQLDGREVRRLRQGPGHSPRGRSLPARAGRRRSRSCWSSTTSRTSRRRSRSRPASPCCRSRRCAARCRPARLVAVPLRGCRLVRPLGIIHCRHHKLERHRPALHRPAAASRRARAIRRRHRRPQRRGTRIVRDRTRQASRRQRLPPALEGTRDHDSAIASRPSRACTIRGTSTTPAASASSSICKGRKSHDIVAQGAPDPAQPGAPRRLRLRDEHRRRRRHPDADAAPLPRRRSASRSSIRLPAPGEYGVGMVFLPTDAARPPALRGAVRADRPRGGPGSPRLARRCRPTTRSLGPTARAAEPVIRQVFIGRQDRGAAAGRRRPGLRAQALRHPHAASRTPCASSDIAAARHVLRPQPVVQDAHLQGHAQRRRSCAAYFPDLHDPAMESALALVHSRFSTNTFPSWARAHPVPLPRPQRRDQHAARQRQLDARPREHVRLASCSATTSRSCCRSSTQSGSDSAMFDNALELLVLAGRSLPHAMMMMIPEPWSGDHETMSAGEEGVLRIPLLPDGAVGRPGLDRLHRRHPHRRRARPQRPAARRATTSPRTTWSSWPPRSACSTSPPEHVLHKGRLQPGRMFLVDLEQGRIIADEELKQQDRHRAALRASGCDDNLVPLDDLPAGPVAARARPRDRAAPPAGLRLHHRGPAAS